MLRPALGFFSSLRLTVVLLVLSMLLIFFSTLDQVNIGIRGAQQEYFESFFAVWRYPSEYWLSEYLGWLHLPLLGGAIVGPLLVINLVSAHFKRYRKFSWKKLGISIIHAGVLLLLIALMVAHILQEDNSMTINEGESSNYLESFYDHELVVIDESDSGKDIVYRFSESQLKSGKQIAERQWPFQIRVRDYYRNTSFAFASEGNPSPFDRGSGQNVVVQEAPPSGRIEKPNIAAASLQVVDEMGQGLGSWLVTTHPALATASDGLQRFEWQGKLFAIGLRPFRTYLPFSLGLVDFSHDKYPGTEKAKNFSSEVRLHHPDKGTDRSVLIYMNHPLRYEGWTFYQSSFANEDTTSIFQVVKNPSWLLPYIACTLVTVGLLYQFGWHLAARGRRS